jgi:hypothetical protein
MAPTILQHQGMLDAIQESCPTTLHDNTHWGDPLQPLPPNPSTFRVVYQNINGLSVTTANDRHRQVTESLHTVYQASAALVSKTNLDWRHFRCKPNWSRAIRNRWTHSHFASSSSVCVKKLAKCTSQAEPAPRFSGNGLLANTIPALTLAGTGAGPTSHYRVNKTDASR